MYSSHYFKPDTETLLEGTKDCKGYVYAINDFTINDENRLSKQVQELKEKNQDSEYVIKGKLQEMIEKNREKDVQIEQMNKAMSTVYEKIETFAKSLAEQTVKSQEINTEQLAQQSKIKILLEIDKKRQELFATKGFVTKEDMILIEESYRDQLNQLVNNNNNKKLGIS